MTETMIERAQLLWDAGLNPMPSTGPNDRNRSPKAPYGDWKDFQTKRMPVAHIQIHLTDNTDRGIGILTGHTTHDDLYLEVLDVEGAAVERGVWDRYVKMLHDSGAGELIDRVRAGYEETTPSGGVHLPWLCSEIGGNTKLANSEFGETLIETRGMGGYIVTAPTDGYRQLQGGPETVAVITPEERDILLKMAAVFDETPESANLEATAERHGNGPVGERPGDIFNARMSWSDVLTPLGWTLVTGDGVGHSSWLRPPNSPHEEVTSVSSATTNFNGNDTMVVFSSSVPLLKPWNGKTKPTSYTKFTIWALYNHGGDFKKAAAAAAELLELPKKTVRRSDNSFIDPRDGLLAVDLMEAVEEMGRLATDENGNIYAYMDGYWQPAGDRIITNRVVELMGNSYRWSYSNTVKTMIGARTPEISDDTIDSRYINCRNGLVDTRTGQLEPHRPEVLSTVQVPHLYNPNAECPLFDSWLSQVVPDDAVEFAWEVIGYSLLNDNPLHKAVMIYGTGRNGKGTYNRVIRALCGAGNVSAVTPQDFGENRFKAAQLVGKLANVVGDVDPRTFRSTETLKQLTGQDAVTVERKNGQPFEFTCRALIIASFNAMPRSSDTTDGFFERWLVLPFTRGYFPVGGATTDTTLSEKLTSSSELEGIFRYAVEALVRVLARQNFIASESVVRATEEFRDHADSLRAFAAARLVDNRDAFTAESTLFAAWKRWCDDNETKPGNAPLFYTRLESTTRGLLGRHVERKKRRGVRGFHGVELVH